MIWPYRPDEAAGRLVSEVNFEKSWLEVGSRLHGDDRTKEGTAFKLPFPEELRPILHACIGGRPEGPLFRSRKVYEGQTNIRSIASIQELERLYQEKLAKAPSGTVVTEQDRKHLVRRLLRELGGVSEDALAKEFKKLLPRAGITDGATLYTLRTSVSNSMKRAKVEYLELTYLTSHSTDDILNDYVSLDPVGAMKLYFDSIRPFLDAVDRQARVLGIILD